MDVISFSSPRPPIMLSLLLTEEEAAICIQAFWRAYLVRCDPEIQELRQWQKQLREDKHIRQRVRMFWTKQEIKGVSYGFGRQSYRDGDIHTHIPFADSLPKKLPEGSGRLMSGAWDSIWVSHLNRPLLLSQVH
nr:IQ domain-containing protein K [Oryctolagus cuniculus]